jgi:drug/metabolite transporter (DMT)-like permease
MPPCNPVLDVLVTRRRRYAAPMIAVLAGTGAAVAFAISTLGSASASRLIGAWATVGWVMAVGLPVALVATAAGGGGFSIDALPWLGIAGLGNVIGLGLEYSALRRGRLGVVVPLVSTEGAIAALIGVLLGTAVSIALGAALAIIAVGGVVTVAGGKQAEDPARERLGASREPPEGGALSPSSETPAIVLAVLAALSFGASLYSAGRVGQALPPAWAALAPRAIGFGSVTLPLAATRRLRLTRAAVPPIVVAGLAEVAGFTCVALGSRADLAVTAILASQFGALAVFGAMVVFRERPTLTQWFGIVVIAAGVGLVAALTR